jgi:hypothetical protein
MRSMRLARILWIGIGVCIYFLSTGYSTWAQCQGAQTVSANGQSFFVGTQDHPMPKSLAPGGSCYDLDEATYLFADTGDANPICRSGNGNGWSNCANGDYAADYRYTWGDSSCNLPYGPYYRGIHILYYKKTLPPNPATYDYDCDGIPDAQDAKPGTPDNPLANLGDPGCNSVKNPTNVATGNKYEEVLDLSISTPGIPLEFRRSYNSRKRIQCQVLT